ncbi:MAG TPA: GNAT family N-acetyltransferase [Dokdonella sp.]
MSLHFQSQNDPFIQSAPACQIRRGVPADAELLARFAARTFVDTYGEYNHPDNLHLHLTTSYGARQQQAELADARIATLLAYRDEGLAAFAQVRCGEVPACVAGAAPVELHRFYVDRVWHGHGVSQSLLAEARRAARDFNAATLWLKVWERNPRAIAFYTKSHFVDVGTADFFVGNDRQTDRVLALDLRRDSAATEHTLV